MSKTMKQSFLIMDEDDTPIAVVMKLELVPSVIFNHELANGNKPCSSVVLRKSKTHYYMYEAEYIVTDTAEFAHTRKRAYVEPITFFDDGSGSCPNEAAPIDYLHTYEVPNYIRHNANGDFFVIVPIPEDVVSTATGKRKDGSGAITFSFTQSSGKCSDEIELPGCEMVGFDTLHCIEGNAMIAVTNEGTTDKPSYTNYLFPFSGLSTAKESLKSLLLSHGIEGRAIIFKIVE